MSGARAGRVRAGGRHRSALHPLHLGHDRASPRAWCATTAATPSRSSGSMSAVYGMGAGEVFWAASDIGWVVGHSYIVYAPLLDGLHHDPLRGQAGRHARSRRVLAGHRPARGERAVHRAHRVPRDQEGRSEGRAHGQARPLAIPHPVPGRRALRSRHALVGARASARAGDRSLVADGDRLGHRGQLRGPGACCRSSRARRPRRCRATTCGC